MRRLRRLTGGERTPILIMTDLEDEGSITRAYQAGATDFITKPINEMVLGQRALYMLRASCTVCELLESQSRVHAQAALLDIAQDAMIVFDLEGSVAFWNAGTERARQNSCGQWCPGSRRKGRRSPPCCVPPETVSPQSLLTTLQKELHHSACTIPSDH
jgi:CheY-like chemotaxis protein